MTETLSQQLVVSGVPAGLYYVRVRASHSAGLGGPSAERIVGVGCVGTLPEATGLTSSVAHGGVVSLSWSPVENATGYLIEAGSATGLSDLALIPVAGPEVNGAVPPGTYYVRVRAVTECGTTGSSNEVMVEVT